MKPQRYLSEPTRWWHWVLLILVSLAPLGAAATFAILAFAS